MTAKDALRKAEAYTKNNLTNTVIIGCSELNDSYVFFTNMSSHEEIVPDMPVIQVNKSTGKTEYMFPDCPYIDPKTKKWVNPLEGAKEVVIY